MSPGRSTIKLIRIAAGGVVLAAVLAACTTTGQSHQSHLPIDPTTASGNGVERVTGGAAGSYVVAKGIHKIKHVIIIMQENRSFDSYFGTYPGAEGIPMRHGVPTVCVPNPKGPCTRPYHDTADINGGGPHGVPNSIADVAGGKMNGFVQQRDKASKTCNAPDDPACSGFGPPDVMGYHTGAEIPNYWAYAKDFSLDDHMFEAVKSWSLPDHLYMVSDWSAKCRNRSPRSCVNDIVGPYGVKQFGRAVKDELLTGKTSIDLAWTDITWLLYAHHVSWAYYVQKGTQPDCANDSAVTCAPVSQNSRTPGIWNPLPLFGDVQHGPSAAEHPAAQRLPQSRQGGHAAGRQLGRAWRPEQRAPARTASIRVRPTSPR